MVEIFFFKFCKDFLFCAKTERQREREATVACSNRSLSLCCLLLFMSCLLLLYGILFSHLKSNYILIFKNVYVFILICLKIRARERRDNFCLLGYLPTMLSGTRTGPEDVYPTYLERHLFPPRSFSMNLDFLHSSLDLHQHSSL